MTYALGYQNIAQLYHQYGADGGDAVLGSVGAMVFLPGVDQRTAEYASKRLGTTTVLQSSSVDVRRGDEFDSERSSEVGRPLMDASEIRQMVKYKQAVAIISNAPPVRLGFPKFAKLATPPLSNREKRFNRAIQSSALEAPIPPIPAKSLPPVEPVAEPQRQETPMPRWDAARWEVGDALEQKLSFEPEYDPALHDAGQLPLFDIELRER